MIGGPGRNGGTLSRRTVVGGLTLAALAGCARGTDDPGAPGPTESRTRDNPLGVDQTKAVEVVVYSGRYGDGYVAAQAQLYNTWAGRDVATATSVTSVKGKLAGRFEADHPPDLVDNAGEEALPTGQLVATNKLTDLQPLLDAPSVDNPATKVADTLLPGTVEAGSFDGLCRVLRYVFAMWGLWYSKRLFGDQGWKPPTTWSELITLAETIRASQPAIAPFASPGASPRYLGALLTGLAIKHGGATVAHKFDNLAKDAWTNDSVRLAAEAIAELHTRGLVLPTAGGQTPLQTQQAWLAGQVALIVSGSWVESEMKGHVPADFSMSVLPFPSLTDSDALPVTAITGAPGESYVVPQHAANALGGMQYLRLMLSAAGAADFAAATGSLIATRSAASALKSPSPGLESVAAAVQAARDDVITPTFGEWYAALQTAYGTEVSALATGKTLPADFMKNMQAASNQVRSDPTVKKFKRT